MSMGVCGIVKVISCEDKISSSECKVISYLIL